MLQFIVSGNIPGTTIQITFDHIALMATILLMMVFSVALVREHKAYHAKIISSGNTPQTSGSDSTA